MKLYLSRAWLTPALLVLLVAAVVSAVPAYADEPSGPVYALQVAGLACPFCAYGIEKQVTRIEGVESTSVDIKEGLVTVVMEQGATLDEEAARTAVEAAGFTLRSFERVSPGPTSDSSTTRLPWRSARTAPCLRRTFRTTASRNGGRNVRSDTNCRVLEAGRETASSQPGQKN